MSSHYFYFAVFYLIHCVWLHNYFLSCHSFAFHYVNKMGERKERTIKFIDDKSICSAFCDFSSFKLHILLPAFCTSFYRNLFFLEIFWIDILLDLFLREFSLGVLRYINCVLSWRMLSIFIIKCQLKSTKFVLVYFEDMRSLEVLFLLRIQGCLDNTER